MPRTQTQTSLFVDAKDLAEILGVSERTVWRMLSRGTLVTPVRLGSLTRWRLADVHEWIDAGCPPQATGNN